MQKFNLKNKKGVSPIIATLLLIVIAVAAAVVTYSFVMGFIGGAGPAQAGQASFVVDASSNTGNVSTAYIRNTGTKSVSLASVYVSGALWNATTSGSTSPAAGGGTLWNASSVTTFTINSTAFTSGANIIKLVFSDNTPFEFNIVK